MAAGVEATVDADAGTATEAPEGCVTTPLFVAVATDVALDTPDTPEALVAFDGAEASEAAIVLLLREVPPLEAACDASLPQAARSTLKAMALSARRVVSRASMANV